MYILLSEPVWPFAGPFVKEDVCVFVGSCFGRYLSVEDVVSVPNRHTQPEEHFLIRSPDLAPIIDSGERVIGIAHRHPPGFPNPSRNDVLGIPARIIGAVWCEGSVSWYTSHGKTNVRYLP